MFDFEVPYHIDGRGQTAGDFYSGHILDLLELLLFTNPGDRVNRPDFGGGARDLVFDCNNVELATALKMGLQANLRRWLSDRVDVQELMVENRNEKLHVQIVYTVRGRDEQSQAAQLPQLF